MKNKPNTMSFDHVLISGLPVKIICLYSGTGILVIDKDTDDELNFMALCEADRETIQDMAFQFRDYYNDMSKIVHEQLENNGES